MAFELCERVVCHGVVYPVKKLENDSVTDPAGTIQWLTLCTDADF